MLNFSIGDYVGEIDMYTNKINVVVPNSKSLTNLIASFVTSDKSVVTVNDVEQESGVTENDFSAVVEYVVTAEDGVNSNTYEVTVVKEEKPELIQFYIDGQIGESSIESSACTVNMPVGTDASQLVANFATFPINTVVTVNNVAQVSGETSNDFTRRVTYKLTTPLGSTKSYAVTVNIEE